MKGFSPILPAKIEFWGNAGLPRGIYASFVFPHHSLT